MLTLQAENPSEIHLTTSQGQARSDKGHGLGKDGKEIGEKLEERSGWRLPTAFPEGRVCKEQREEGRAGEVRRFLAQSRRGGMASYWG